MVGFAVMPGILTRPGIGHHKNVQTLVERVFRHERGVLIAVLAAATAACWWWIVPMARDMYGAMTGPSAWMMTSDWDTRRLLLLAAMWIVMMAGMMLPSAGPMLLLYAGSVRHRGGGAQATLRVYAMAAGYLLVWAGFSLIATLLQRVLSSWLMLSPMMESTSPQISGSLLILAGVYQFTPLKHACLASCSAPVAFLMRRWRDGTFGAFRLGLEHGVLCVGCCWALMLLLFAGGVMNLTVIAALTAFVLIEKLTPFGLRSVRVTGAALVAFGIWIVTR
jgi:predicted metal-binding membrane protein